jgi:aquaporin TIP
MAKTSTVTGAEFRDHVVVLRFPSLRAEFASLATRRALAVEMLGVLLFVFLAAGAAVMTMGAPADRLSAARVLAVGLAHALAFGLAVALAAPLSGGHLNPAITLGAVMAGRMPAGRGAIYVLAQLMGAVAAAVLLNLVVPGARANGLGTFALGARVTPEQAVVVEGILTCALLLAFFATSRDALRPWAGVVLGATVLLAHLFGMGLTGASMNPARSFGPALVAGQWSSHWVYWVGPVAGALVAVGLWRWVFASKAD